MEIKQQLKTQPAARDDAAAAAGHPPLAAFAPRADRRDPQGARRQPGPRRRRGRPSRRGRRRRWAPPSRDPAAQLADERRAHRAHRDGRAARSTRSDGPRRRRVQEIDWEKFLENRTLQQPLQASRGGFDELPPIEQNLTKQLCSSTTCSWQLQLSDFTDAERRFAELVLGNLDDKGFLDLKGIERENGERTPDITIEELADEAGARPGGRPRGAPHDAGVGSGRRAARAISASASASRPRSSAATTSSSPSSTSTSTTWRSTTTRPSRAT